MYEQRTRIQESERPKSSDKMNQIYSKEHYIVFYAGTGYIVRNIKKSQEYGHTHLKHFKICKTLIDLAINHQLPRSGSEYLLDSLIRISDDDGYIEKVEKLKKIRSGKTKLRCKKRYGYDK